MSFLGHGPPARASGSHGGRLRGRSTDPRRDDAKIVVEQGGGFYSEGPAAAFDSQEPQLRTMLGFMDITDVTFVRAERLAIDPAAAAEVATNDAHSAADWALCRAA